MLLLPAVSGSLNRLAFHAPLLLEPPTATRRGLRAPTDDRRKGKALREYGESSRRTSSCGGPVTPTCGEPRMAR